MAGLIVNVNVPPTLFEPEVTSRIDSSVKGNITLYIRDIDTGKLIKATDISGNVSIINPFEIECDEFRKEYENTFPFYFIEGHFGTKEIFVTAEKYQKERFKIFITKFSTEHTVYLKSSC